MYFIKNIDFSKISENGSLKNKIPKGLSFWKLLWRTSFFYELHQKDIWTCIHLKKLKKVYKQNDTISIINRDDKGLLLGGYLQGKIKLNNNKIQIESGIRTSYFDVTKETYFSPRAS